MAQTNKRNPSDLTGRNLRTSRDVERELRYQIRMLAQNISAVERRLRRLEERVAEPAKKLKAFLNRPVKKSGAPTRSARGGA